MPMFAILQLVLKAVQCSEGHSHAASVHVPTLDSISTSGAGEVPIACARAVPIGGADVAADIEAAVVTCITDVSVPIRTNIVRRAVSEPSISYRGRSRAGDVSEPGMPPPLYCPDEESEDRHQLNRIEECCFECCYAVLASDICKCFYGCFLLALVGGAGYLAYQIVISN